MCTTRSRFRPDGGLSVRVAATVVALALVYAAFVLLVESTIVVRLIAGGVLAAQCWFSDRLTLAAMRAVVVTPEQEPRLHGVVDRLCAMANMPGPQGAVADTDVSNAFSTGRSAAGPSRALRPGCCAGSTPRSWRACWRTSCRTSRTGRGGVTDDQA